MTEAELLRRVEIDPRVMLGKPLIRGTRITVELILDKLASDRTIESVLEDYPHLQREDLLAALTFARMSLGSDEFIPRMRAT